MKGGMIYLINPCRASDSCLCTHFYGLVGTVGFLLRVHSSCKMNTNTSISKRW
jgi:hypothetical protein